MNAHVRCVYGGETAPLARGAAVVKPTHMWVFTVLLELWVFFSHLINRACERKILKDSNLIF